MSRQSSRARIKGDAQKFALHLETETLEGIRAEARRQDRSVAWIIRRALVAGLPIVCAAPSAIMAEQANGGG